MNLENNSRKSINMLKNPKLWLLLAFIIILIMALAGRCADTESRESENTPAAENVNSETESPETGSRVNTVPYDPADPYAVFEGALFIGDSRTEGLRIYSGIDNADFFCAKSMSIDKILAGKKVNVGGNDMSVSETLAAKEYSRIYVCLGINELGWNSSDEFINQYEILLDEIIKQQPNADIYVVLLFPVTASKSEKEAGGTVNNARIYEYNVKLVDLANKKGLKYLNPDQPLLDGNGCLKEEASTDGVHLLREYYIIWAEYLAQITY